MPPFRNQAVNPNNQPKINLDKMKEQQEQEQSKYTNIRRKSRSQAVMSGVTLHKKIPKDILASAIKRYKEDGVGIDDWDLTTWERIRYACGTEYQGYPLEDLRVQGINSVRKSGGLKSKELQQLEELYEAGRHRIRHSKLYKDYISRKSPEWLDFCSKVFSHWGGICAICGYNPVTQVHHRTYDRLGHELMTDVIPVCQKCHRSADKRYKLARTRDKIRKDA